MFAPVRPWRRRLGLAALVVAVLLLVVVTVVPPVARRQVQTRLSAQLGRPVRVGAITLNPFTARLRVRGLEVFEPDGESLAIGFADAAVNLDPVRSALRRAVVVSEVTVRGPHAVIVRRADGSMNVSDLFDRGADEEPPEAPSGVSRLPRIILTDILIDEGWAIFRDEQQGARQRLMGLRLAIPRVSTLPGDDQILVTPTFRADLNGRELVLDGSTRPFTARRNSNAQVRLQGFDLTALAPYLPAPRTADLTSGRLDIELRAAAEAGVEGARPTVSLTGTVVLRDLCLSDSAGETVASLGAFQVSLLPADVLQPAIHIGRVQVTAPFFRLQRQADGSLVLPQFGSPSPDPAPPAATPAATPALTATVDEVVIEAGRLAFSDASVTPAFTTTVDIGLEAAGLTTEPDRPAQVHITARTDSEASLEGTYRLIFGPTPGVAGTTALRGLRLPELMPYLEPFLKAVIADGVLAVTAEHDVALPADAPARVVVSDLDLVLAGLAVQPADPAAAPLRLAELTVTDARLDLAGRSVTLGSVAARGGEIPIERRQDGSINLQDLLRGGDTSTPAEAGTATGQEPPGGATPTAPTAPTAPGQPWTVAVDDLALSDWAIRLDDRQPGQPVRLSLGAIGLHVRNLSTAPGATSNLDLGLTINDGGTLKVSGDLGLKPLSATLTVVLQDLALADFQNYLRDHLELLVHGGALGTDLRVTLNQADGAPLAGQIEGALALRDLSLVGVAAGGDLLSCRELALRGIRVDLTPLAVRLDEVALTGLGTALTVHPDGTLNLLAVLPRSEATPAVPAASSEVVAPAPPAGAGQDEAAPLPFSIGTLRLQDCALVFTDEQLTPHYRVQLGALSGSVTGFSMTGAEPAQVDLTARLDGHAPVTLSGSLANPGPQMVLKLSTALKDFDLGPVSPYTGRYVGYAVQKGKLSFDLDYALEHRQLAAQHHVLIDQFAFGQKVESAAATQLPVRLAVSLLKDRRGRINLDVPVRGSLDDPEFSVLRVVVKVLRDLVTKAASAPFALLGSLVGGGGEELSTIDFASGSADLDEVAIDKLSRLGKALQERPELQLEVAGMADPAADHEGLAGQALQRQLRARKLAELAAAGRAVPAQAAIELSEKDLEAFLKALYREAVGTAPAGDAPVATTPAEIEAALLARIKVSAPEVRLLAGQRAARVREFLTTTAEIAQQRVFVVESVRAAAATPGSTAASSARQARLSLR